MPTYKGQYHEMFDPFLSQLNPTGLLLICYTLYSLQYSIQYTQVFWSCVDTCIRSGKVQKYTDSNVSMTSGIQTFWCQWHRNYVSVTFPGLGIRSFAHLLISLKSNERLWAIRSDCSRQMSNREQIPQVAQRKWVTMSESLRLLKTNEWPWAICSGLSEDMSEWVLRSKNFG